LNGEGTRGGSVHHSIAEFLGEVRTTPRYRFYSQGEVRSTTRGQHRQYAAALAAFEVVHVGYESAEY
jgi:hypothetical protein